MKTKFFKDFKEASNCAKKVALDKECTISLGRAKDGFYVEVPDDIESSEAAETLEFESEYDFDSEHNVEQESYDNKEEDRLITEEILDYGDSMAQSEDDGWFYTDN